jgi:proteasome alpha subunit
MMYSREDVTARSLANGYSQILGTLFSQEMKPYEVELLLAQVGETPEHNELYRISFDGSIVDERKFTAIGGRSEAILTLLRKETPEACPSLKEALTLCQHAFELGADSRSSLEGLEVALLDRTRKGRKFRRIPTPEASQILA